MESKELAGDDILFTINTSHYPGNLLIICKFSIDYLYFNAMNKKRVATGQGKPGKSGNISLQGKV